MPEDGKKTAMIVGGVGLAGLGVYLLVKKPALPPEEIPPEEPELPPEEPPEEPPELLAKLYGMVFVAVTEEPLANAVVELWSSDETELLVTAYTDAVGNYEIINILPGDYLIITMKENYESSVMSMALNSGNNRLDIALGVKIEPPEPPEEPPPSTPKEMLWAEIDEILTRTGQPSWVRSSLLGFANTFDAAYWAYKSVLDAGYKDIPGVEDITDVTWENYLRSEDTLAYYLDYYGVLSIWKAEALIRKYYPTLLPEELPEEIPPEILPEEPKLPSLMYDYQYALSEAIISVEAGYPRDFTMIPSFGLQYAEVAIPQIKGLMIKEAIRVGLIKSEADAYFEGSHMYYNDGQLIV